MPVNRRRVSTDEFDESRTIQSDASRADIKQILKRYKELGIVDHLRHVDAQYRDVSEFTDLTDALNQAAQAELEFMRLPSKVREMFNHDVAEWLDTAHDPAALEGLAKKYAQLQAGRPSTSVPDDEYVPPRGRPDNPPESPPESPS